jgi:hypothetical protein
LKEVSSSLTNQQLNEMIEKLEKENLEVSTKVEAFKSGGIEMISEDKINIMIKE